MTYGSVCSGIEAATVAWEPLGWKAAFYSEIEPFPCAVLQHRYPQTPNYGDMTKYKEWSDADIDVLVGGTPCQSFSVAGLRKGLADPRGNLMLIFGAIASKYRPTWLVWENVPGVLSSNGGRDFGTFLGMLAELGYGFAYRVFDAQFVRVESHRRAVPQRRRRVFVVGYFGDWRRAAAVLFERESLSGDSPPSRETGQRVAGTLKGGSGNRGYPDPSDGNGGGLVPTLRSGSGGGVVNQAVALPINTQIATRGEKLGEGTGLGIGEDGDPSFTLQAAHCHAVAYTLDQTQGQAVAFTQNQVGDVLTGEIMHSLTTNQNATGRNAANVMTNMQVRRLTPVECERLQAFPDNYTRIPWRDKPEEQCPDGPRYKALGNSMATNVMRHIGDRIELVTQIMEAM